MKKDEVKPEGKWVFDQAVTDSFEDMLTRSIPQYELMRKLCFDIGSSFVTPGTAVVDLGSSRGEAMEPFVKRFGAFNQFVGVEVSQPMLNAFSERFAGYIRSGVVEARPIDLTEAYPPINSSLTLSILTLQFTPIEYRQNILRNVITSTTPGGAFILVEKVLGKGAAIDELLVKNYHQMKRDAGYSDEQIMRKSLSLRGVLVPVTADWNEDMLSSAGFRSVECFWRCLNFAGWLAVK